MSQFDDWVKSMYMDHKKRCMGVHPYIEGCAPPGPQTVLAKIKSAKPGYYREGEMKVLRVNGTWGLWVDGVRAA